MNDSTRLKNALQFQFNISWQLLDYHLTGLEDDEMLWKPTPFSLHVEKVNDNWLADWPESEDYKMGNPSIAWTTWHILFWWSMVFDYSFGEGTLTKDEVYWPGSAEKVKAELNQFRNQWEELLASMTDEDLMTTAKIKWPFADRPFYDLASWLNLELMKNAAEIGSGRFLYASDNHENVKK